ncbi:MAG: hypothetical protein R3323_00795 [Wenzhouxiangellaceae bacterium]|nr:hypothetical protein [Wenzhouxiangellaceae bacterium]
MARDEEKDIYEPGISDDQVRRAEEMLGGLDVPLSIERRNQSEDFREAELIPGDRMADPIPALVSESEINGVRVVLTRDPVPAMSRAEIVMDRRGTQVSYKGRLTESRAGKRAEDRMQYPPLQVSFLDPD